MFQLKNHNFYMKIKNFNRKSKFLTEKQIHTKKSFIIKAIESFKSIFSFCDTFLMNFLTSLVTFLPRNFHSIFTQSPLCSCHLLKCLSIIFIIIFNFFLFSLFRFKLFFFSPSHSIFFPLFRKALIIRRKISLYTYLIYGTYRLHFRSH